LDTAGRTNGPGRKPWLTRDADKGAFYDNVSFVEVLLHGSPAPRKEAKISLGRTNLAKIKYWRGYSRKGGLDELNETRQGLLAF
jgi:hypothetical protein